MKLIEIKHKQKTERTVSGSFLPSTVNIIPYQMFKSFTTKFFFKKSLPENIIMHFL